MARKIKQLHQVRQGDVMLVLTDVIPQKAQKSDTNIVADGEVTGHHHRIVGEDVQLYTLEGNLFAKVGQVAVLSHEEHGAIQVEPGVYRVIRQRQYNPNGVARRVRD